ncbi:MAG: HAD-IA family hydrolase [Coriobacteriia bacterium]|nr:HAD-IA family hydrolase [Coriobacteriia bacterium]
MEDPCGAEDPAAKYYSALLFDLDGTILDTRALILASYHYACDKVLKYRLPDEPLLELIGIPLTEQMKKLVPAEQVEAMVSAYREHNAIGQTEYLDCFPNTHETLATFAEAGWPLALVTSKINSSAREGLEAFDLLRYFDLLIGFDDTEKHKPDPEPLLLAASTLKISPEKCVYIGDSIYDMQAAKAAGMLAIGALWGFSTIDLLLEAGADLVVSQTSMLPQALSFLQYEEA